MYVRNLQLTDYRSWAELDLALTPGVTVFSGPNGHGKTNIVEALGYLAHLSSHRVNSDAALVRQGQSIAQLTATAVNNGRELTARLALKAHGANKAHINRAAMNTPRELLGIVRTTLFSPEDLALVRGEPEQRRNFLDAIMVARYPRLAAVKADYDKALRQRNALLRNSAFALRMATDTPRGTTLTADNKADAESALATLDVWDAQLAALGGQIMSARVQIVHDLSPHLSQTYQRLAPESRPAFIGYTSTIDELLAHLGIRLGTSTPDAEPALLSPGIAEATLLQALADKRAQEIDRGTTLLGPHRDDMILMLGTQPAKGFASHGESWSFALSLRLAAFFMQEGDGTSPIIILDDVFAELDRNRRARLVELIKDAEQVLITAAVDEDIPQALRDIATIYTVEASTIDTPEGAARVSAITGKEAPEQ
ncbi:MAG TPA: DNA replication/repair protein RecF [Candidatus Corynebacterium gallistercoris]|uniref:DNA replication and repair protein RecF n=1 Tax=Candidatus Corynebacterium gallistercoris TaxID=2838530 RepID=A0A9D1RVC5_9CORY|nr:DNA replication/repair protein RecF [Candidatus Corynebacterium gallistercoris]